MKLEYSQQAENIYGYSIAKLKDGTEAKYTNYINDENDKPGKEDVYMWKDKVTTYQGKDSDISSHDYTNNRQVPSAGALLGSNIGKGSGKAMATIMGNIISVRASAMEQDRIKNEVQKILKK